MITIVIPTIGRGKTFGRAFYSAIKWDNRLVSNIIVIDNSQLTDFSNHLKDLIETTDDNRVSVITLPERASMGKSWNSSLDLINTDWVLYLHDDDELIDVGPHIESIRDKLIENSNVGFIAFDFQCRFASATFRKNKKVIYRWPELIDVNILIDQCPKFVSTIINVAQLRKIQGFSDDYGYFLDFIAFLKIHRSASALTYPLVLGVYHLHEDNESDIRKRAAGYGNFIPQTCKTFYEICHVHELRHKFMKSVLGYSYMRRKGIFSRMVNALCSI